MVIRSMLSSFSISFIYGSVPVEQEPSVHLYIGDGELCNKDECSNF